MNHMIAGGLRPLASNQSNPESSTISLALIWRWHPLSMPNRKWICVDQRTATQSIEENCFLGPIVFQIANDPIRNSMIDSKRLSLRTLHFPLQLSILFWASFELAAQPKSSGTDWRLPTESEAIEFYQAIIRRANPKAYMALTVAITETPKPVSEIDREAREEANLAMKEFDELGIEWIQEDWEGVRKANYDSWLQSGDGLRFFKLDYWSDSGLKRWDQIELPVSNSRDVQQALSGDLTPSGAMRRYMNLDSPEFSAWRSFMVNEERKVANVSRFLGHQWGWTNRDYTMAGMAEPELVTGVVLAFCDPFEFKILDPDLSNLESLTLSPKRLQSLLSRSHPDFAIDISKTVESNREVIKYRIRTRIPDDSKKRNLVKDFRQRLTHGMIHGNLAPHENIDFTSVKDLLLSDAPYATTFEYHFNATN